MQYVRSISGSVAKTWNSINPATLSGAIDVIVVEQEDGSLACSPFHVRFGKFSLLQPYEKKVEFRVNNEKQNYAMKLGEGGEAFFVFETSDNIPEDLQTSPLVSATTSPALPADGSPPLLQEPEFLDLSNEGKPIARRNSRPSPSVLLSTSAPKKSSTSDTILQLSGSLPDDKSFRPLSGDWSGLERHNTDDALIKGRSIVHSESDGLNLERQNRSLTPMLGPQDITAAMSRRSNSPPPLSTKEAIERAQNLSKQLADSNIPSHVTESGDLMLDMTGYKSNEEDALRAEVIARKILSEELEGNYDIGALIGADEHGNLWIYSSEEAKEAAMQKALVSGIQSSVPASPMLTADAVSDPGYHSEGDSESASRPITSHRRVESEHGGLGLRTPPSTPPDSATGLDLNRNYAKTLRLTSDQLKALNLKPGPNPISFTVNRATCSAYMYLWKHDVPIVISDIDGTITKSDALGHVLNMIGRDWTHIGVAKLYTEIIANGYNIMYLTSRSVGQADSTRAYLNGILQDGFKLPKGPVIMSPDRTIAALRRELYIRKPEVFKMACLRDIKTLFGPGKTPFYAGFGNRLTDALSYRSVSIPSNRIFTINSNAEVSLDLLSLSKLKLSYVNMREVVDHYFPPVGLLIKGGGEDFTDFNYWREAPLEIEDFSDSEEEDEEEDVHDDKFSDNVDEDVGEMGDSYISQVSGYDNEDDVNNGSVDDDGEGEGRDEDYDEDEYDEEPLSSSVLEGDELLSPVLERAEDEDTREIAGLEPVPQTSEQTGEQKEDTDAEIITGTSGLSLQQSDSEPREDIS